MNDVERYLRSEYKDAEYQRYRWATEARSVKAPPRPRTPTSSPRSGFVARLEKAFLQIRFSLYLRP